MNDEIMREQVHKGIDRHCAPLTSDPYRVQRILIATKPEGGKCMGKKITRTAVVLIALLVLGISTAIATGIISWQRGLEDMLRVTDETKEYYQWTDLFDAPDMSITQGNVTITLEESIVDSNAAHFAFRVKGYQPPEGKQPAFASTVYTIKDNSIFINGDASFFNGLVSNGEGTAVYLDGSIPEDYSAVSYTDENGELVYTISLFTDTPNLIGQTMTVTLTDLGFYTDKWGTHEVQAPGTWRFEWALKGADHYWDFSGLNLNIGTSGSTVTHVHLSPIHIQLTMDVGPTLSEYEKHEDGDILIPFFYGLKMKDGRRYELISEAGTTGYTSPDPHGHEYQMLFMLNRIIEPAQVNSFLFSCPDGTGGHEIVEVPFNQ